MVVWVIVLIGWRWWDIFRYCYIRLRWRGDRIWISCIGCRGIHDCTLVGYVLIFYRIWIVCIKIIVWRGCCGVGLVRGDFVDLVFVYKFSGVRFLCVVVRVGGIGWCN